jgi:hypothetical protein
MMKPSADVGSRPAAPVVRVLGSLACGVVALVAGACEVPTSLPGWSTSWVVPAKSTTLGVAQLLPASVTLTPDHEALRTSLPSVSFSRSLGELCGAPCAGAASFAKPAFTGSFGGTIDLPAGVVGAQVAAGRMAVRITNRFSFDPLRPTPGSYGSLTIRVTSGAATLAAKTIEGAQAALPAGASLDETLPLAGARVSGPMTVSVELASPAGDVIQVDASQQLAVTATPEEIRLSEASVSIGRKDVTLPATALGVRDIDSMIWTRVTGGALRLSIANPFQASGTMTLLIYGPNPELIEKTLDVPAGSSVQRVEFSAEELKSLLGKPDDAILEGRGTFTATGAITVSPKSAIAITSQLELTLGGEEN